MKIKTVFIIAIVSIIFINCKDVNGKKSEIVELITVDEMDSLLELQRVQLVDVRTPKEYEDGHIEGAININFNDKNFESLISKVDKSKPVAVYCGRGGRSGKCSNYMIKAGFTKIYDLDGGITEWKYKGKSVVK